MTPVRPGMRHVRRSGNSVTAEVFNVQGYNLVVTQLVHYRTGGQQTAAPPSTKADPHQGQWRLQTWVLSIR